MRSVAKALVEAQGLKVGVCKGFGSKTSERL